VSRESDVVPRRLIQFRLYLSLTSCIPEISSSFLMTSGTTFYPQYNPLVRNVFTHNETFKSICNIPYQICFLST
jgi:hypothetical protein